MGSVEGKIVERKSAARGDCEKEQTHFGVLGLLCMSHTTAHAHWVLTEHCLLDLTGRKTGDRWSDGFEQWAREKTVLACVPLSQDIK